MDDKVNGKTGPGQEKIIADDVNAIEFTFLERGSANFNVTQSQGNITALQLLALSAWLEFEGKSLLSEERYQRIQHQMQQAEKNKIHVAEPGTVIPGR